MGLLFEAELYTYRYNKRRENSGNNNGNLAHALNLTKSLKNFCSYNALMLKLEHVTSNVPKGLPTLRLLATGHLARAKSYSVSRSPATSHHSPESGT